jgi:hypothetical protein
MALVIHPHAIRYLVSGKSLPNNLFAYLDCQIQADSDSKSVNAISFSPLSTDGRWFTLKQLKRSNNEAFFQNLLDSERYVKADCHTSDAYDFTISLAAITENYIYIRKDETMFYKVPKSLNDLLDEVDFNSSVGVLSFDRTPNGQSSTYIAFDDFNLYYDISTSEMMAEHQIEVVDMIHL